MYRYKADNRRSVKMYNALIVYFSLLVLLFKEVKGHFKLLAYYLKYNFIASMEYRAMFISQAFGMALNNSVFIIFWMIIFKNTGPIGGYGLNDVMFIWAISSAGFGFGNIIFGNYYNIGNQIQNGELDVYLLQPKNPLFSMLASRTIISAWGDFIYGYIIFFIFLKFSVFKFILFSLLVVSSSVVFIGSFTIAEQVAFFTGSSRGVAQLFREFVISFSIYPESIFGNRIRWLFYTLFPAGFVSFLPRKIFNDFSWKESMMLLGFDILLVIANHLLFKAGLKRYESGNLIGTRL
jgi:ABC-2 type transport system permease protein